MTSVQQLVTEFHRAFDQAVAQPPTASLIRLRERLITEELTELAKELADLVYVAYGTAVSFGIDLDAVIAEVHRSNMSKLGEDGKPLLRADGKALKPPGYVPPDLTGVLEGCG